MNAASPPTRHRLGSRVAQQRGRGRSTSAEAARVEAPRSPPPTVVGPAATTDDSVSSAGRTDSIRAVKSAGLIGSSLLLTQIIGFVGNSIVVTRLLGNRYGPVRFADSFAMLSLMGLALGVDTYIRKEVPIRPQHARDFASGILGVRLLGAGVFIAGSVLVLRLTHRTHEEMLLVALFGLGQLLQHISETSGAYLQSVGSVREAVMMRIVAKVAWIVAVVVGLEFHVGLWIVPMAMVLSEGSKAVVLGLLSRRRLQLQFHVDWRATWAVLVASLPFLMTHINITISSTLDVSMVGFLTNNREVANYGAATNLSIVALILAPVISWVLLPLMSRALARSEEEFWQVIRRSLEVILTTALPLSVLLSLNADVVVTSTVGDVFRPAIPALRILAPMFVLTYVGMMCGSALIRLERGWLVARVGLAGVAFNVALNLVMIRGGLRWWGPGGAGTGASISIVLAELGVTGAYVCALGRRAFDAQTARTVATTVLASALIVLLDRTISPLCRSVPLVRPFIDLSLFLVHLLGLGVIRPAELRRLVRGGGFS